jgi:hypothetical protein
MDAPPASVTVSPDEVTLHALKDVIQLFSVWTILLLNELELERLACNLQEVGQLLNFKKSKAIAGNIVVQHHSDQGGPVLIHPGASGGNYHILHRGCALGGE